MVGGQRELIAPARTRTGHRCHITLAGMRGGILDRVAGLVGEFAKIDLMGVAGAGQHADIGPGAEHPFLA